LKCLRDGSKTAYDIAQKIPWMTDRGGIAFESLPVWDKRMAITETLAHLKLLTEEGGVSNVAMDGASMYISRD
jgi:hypothetical protein